MTAASATAFDNTSNMSAPNKIPAIVAEKSLNRSGLWREKLEWGRLEVNVARAMGETETCHALGPLILAMAQSI